MEVEGDWSDLRDKGYVVVRSFLAADQLAHLRDTFAAKPFSANENYRTKEMTWSELDTMRDSVEAALQHVRQQTSFRTDLLVRGVYFSTEHGKKFDWHQDYETYWMSQDGFENFNFYIPLVKPVREKSNVCIIPFDRLKARAPELYPKIAGRGASRFSTSRGKTRMLDDNDDRRRTLKFSIDELACVPHLAAGDLLLLRGDIVHRTQDADTSRVAISLRAVTSTAPVSRRILVSGGLAKVIAMLRNREVYHAVLQRFDEVGGDRLPVGEAFQCGRVPVSRLTFLAGLCRHKLYNLRPAALNRPRV
jgi:ectoine hydroxylase-related dioxygenase (phytanoyl-CoA dioxygenase family)